MIEPEKNRYVFVNGKGGVGKTTIAASLAINWADKGHRCLLVSTDPAHNLGDLFGSSFSDSTIREITPNLDALEIDSDKEAESYISSVKQRVRDIVDPELIQEAYRHIEMAAQSPGTAEAALLQRFVSVLLDLDDRYDNIIFDTAPSGHTLRLLALPDTMGTWMEGMLSIRKSVSQGRGEEGKQSGDPVLDVLQRRQERLHRVHKLLLDSEQAQFLPVTLPEQVPLAETARIKEMLQGYGFSVQHLIINKLIVADEGSELLSNRMQEQQEALNLYRQKFNELHQIEIPYHSNEIVGIEMLRKVGGHLN